MAQATITQRTLRREALLTGIGLLVVHVGALAAFIPGTFTWSGVAVAVALFYITGGLGISLCFHRILTHRSFQCPRWFEYILAVCGTLALQGGPIDWVATHRVHHAKADRKGDPHNVHRGLSWAHMEWLYRYNDARPTEAEKQRLAADLFRDPFYRLLDRAHIVPQLVLGVTLFALGGWSWLIWGVFVRIAVTYHITWLVNSAAHHSGYRTFRTDDQSTNNWWVALLTWGEGWHNNHHAFPSSARHGLRWIEADTTWYAIRILAMLRLARNIKVPTMAMMQRLAIRSDEHFQG